MAVPDVCLVELSPCFTKEAAASALVVKGLFVAVAKKGKITMDTNLNKKHLGVLYAWDAGNFHFSSSSVLFFRLS